MKQVRSESMALNRVSAILLSVFAGLALLLAAIGIYGIISWSVTQRTHEIGLRTALGAASQDVLRMIVGNALSLAAVGVTLGLAGAFAATRILTTVLFDVKPTDPLTFASVAIILTAIALAAAYIPARRATRIDPLEALRHE
jgi:putative ABC transport system permease protein